MLTTLLHSGVGQIVAVCTRYYGGVKLGTGGLSRAYSGGVSLALESLPTEERVERVPVVVTVGYPEVNAVQKIIDELSLLVLEEDFGAQVRYRLGVPVDDTDELTKRVADVTRGAGLIERES